MPLACEIQRDFLWPYRLCPRLNDKTLSSTINSQLFAEEVTLNKRPWRFDLMVLQGVVLLCKPFAFRLRKIKLRGPN